MPKHDRDSSSHLEPSGIQKLKLVYDLHSLKTQTGNNWVTNKTGLILMMIH